MLIARAMHRLRSHLPTQQLVMNTCKLHRLCTTARPSLADEWHLHAYTVREASARTSCKNNVKRMRADGLNHCSKYNHNSRAVDAAPGGEREEACRLTPAAGPRGSLRAKNYY